MTIKIIALAGAAGSGKSEIAKYLAEQYGARRYAFATPLKEIVRRAFDLSNAQLYGTQADKEAVDPRYNVSPRWLMTHIGTEGIRAVFGPNFWAEQTIASIRRDLYGGGLAVIEDCRFHSEAQIVSAARLLPDVDRVRVVRIINPHAAVTADPSHQSEAEWRTLVADSEWRINTYGIPELHRLVDFFMNSHGLV